MENEGGNWLGLPKYTDEYVNGVKAFIGNAFARYAIGKEIRCPCRTCNNKYWHTNDVIFYHLICEGPSVSYIKWIYEVAQSIINLLL